MCAFEIFENVLKKMCRGTNKKFVTLSEHQSLLMKSEIVCRKCFVIRGVGKSWSFVYFFPVPSIHQREKPCLRNASFYSSVDTTLSRISSDKTFLTFLSSNLRHEVIGIWTLSGRANKKWVKINIFAFVWRLVKCVPHTPRGMFLFAIDLWTVWTFVSFLTRCSDEHFVSDCDDGVPAEAERAGRRWQAAVRDA